MNPSTILTNIFKVGKTLHDINKQVKVNKNQCNSKFLFIFSINK